METAFRITLEYVRFENQCHLFRLAFDDSNERLLLPYPDITGLQFTDCNADVIAEWKTSILASYPLDDFVLNPESRIAFDLYAQVNTESESNISNRWSIQLPVGEALKVHYVFEVASGAEWYDFLAKRSRFVAITKQWRGKIQSNGLPFIAK